MRKKLLFIVCHRPKAESERVLEQTKDVGSGIFKVGFPKTQHQKNQNSAFVRLHAVGSLRCDCFVETTIFMTKGHVNSAWKKVLFSYKKLYKNLFIYVRQDRGFDRGPKVGQLLARIVILSCSIYLHLHLHHLRYSCAPLNYRLLLLLPHLLLPLLKSKRDKTIQATVRKSERQRKGEREVAIKEIFSTPIPALVHVVTINLIRFGVVLRSLLSIVNRVAAAILFDAYITSTFCSCMMLYMGLL